MCFSLHVKPLANAGKHTKQPQNIKQCGAHYVLRYVKEQQPRKQSVLEAALEMAADYRTLRD